MDWFKHATCSNEDPDISDAWDLFGDMGPNIFWVTLEIYGREFSHLDENGFLDLSRTFLERKLRRKWKTIEQVFIFYQKRNRFEFTFFENGSRISLKIPKFITLASTWTAKTNRLPTQAPTQAPTKNLPTDKDKEIDKEIEKKKKKKKTIAPSDKNPSLEAVLQTHRKEYSEAYPGIDLDQETAKAKAWMLSNPKNKKKNLARFLNNWLSKAQDQVSKFPPKGEGYGKDRRDSRGPYRESEGKSTKYAGLTTVVRCDPTDGAPNEKEKKI